MQHLVSFGNAPEIRVPYVCQRTFSGSIHDYPERQGWDQDALYRGNLEGRSLPETQGFLQEWLFFGPLFLAFDVPGMEFDADDFVETDSQGGKWVTTEKLPAYATKWFFMAGEYPNRMQRPLEQREADFQRLRGGLGRIHRFVLRYCGRESNNGTLYPPATFWPVTPELSLSIIALCDALTYMSFHGTNRQLNLVWGESGLLHDRMLARGWCHSALNHLVTPQSISLVYTAHTLGPPPVPMDHGECTRWVCRFDHVDEATYKTNHRSESCECAFQGPEMKKVTSILERGGMPLVRCLEKNGSLDVDVTEYDAAADDKRYIAVSHIWSDGLGNPFMNRLPLCQLRHIQTLVNNATSDGAASTQTWWWCDTLCVPVSQEDLEARKTAISRMAKTYKEAIKVLVLDSELLSIPINTPTIEIVIRLRTSKWMRRLWTLQEGILGKAACIQLRDGTIDLGQLRQDMMQTEFRTRRSIYTRYSMLVFEHLAPYLQQQQQPAASNPPRPAHERLTGLIRHLQSRSTSRRGDEPLCLGTMLGFDEETLAGLMALPSEDWEGRMAYFLKKLGTINQSMLYQPRPRVQTVGYRWAPSSFMTCFKEAATLQFAIMPRTAEVDPDGRGLLCKSGGVMLMTASDEDEVLPLIGHDFHIQKRDVETGMLGELLRVGYFGTPADPHSDRNATNVDGTRNLSHPAIIISRGLSTMSSQPGSIHGALVDVVVAESQGKEGASGTVRERGMIECVHIAWVGIGRATLSNFPTGGMKTLEVEEMVEEQEWLVM